MFKTIVFGHLVYFQAVYKVVKNYHLVGGFNPSEKYRQNGFIFPKDGGEKKQSLKPPPRN